MVSCQQNPRIERVAGLGDAVDKALKDRAVLVAVGEPVDVFHHERLWLRSGEDRYVSVQQRHLGVSTRALVLQPVAALGERSTRRPSMDNIRLSSPEVDSLEKLSDIKPNC